MLAKIEIIIIRDIWPVLNHHITLFSLYEFCLVKVFSSKSFNEVISTKLYASSLIFPYRGFYEWWLQAYSILEFNMSFTHNPKALCTPYFSHRVFEEIIYLKTVDRWSNEVGIDQGGVLENLPCDLIPRGATVRGVPSLCIYMYTFHEINTTVTFSLQAVSRFHSASTIWTARALSLRKATHTMVECGRRGSGPE